MRASLPYYAFLKKKEKIIAKIGTDALCTPAGDPDERVMDAFTRQMAALHHHGNKVLIVTSGAVGLGLRELGLDRKAKHDNKTKAVAASIGQPILMDLYSKYFKKWGLRRAPQALLENGHFLKQSSGGRFVFKSVLDHMWTFPDLVPVLNENDVTSFAEIRPLKKGLPGTFSDNDGLASLVADLVKADRLIMVSMNHVFTQNPTLDPSARSISRINFASDDQCPSKLGIKTEGSSIGGRDGMENKLRQIRLFLGEGPCGKRRGHIIGRDDMMNAHGLLRAASDQPVGTALICARPAYRGQRNGCGPEGILCENLARPLTIAP